MTGVNQDEEQATPLDILLNAIQGTNNQFDFDSAGQDCDILQDQAIDLDHFVNTDEQTPTESKNPKLDQATKSISADLTRSPSLRPLMTVPPAARYKPSTIQVWHPRAGQKSYGKERRILNPPPILTVKGPLSTVLTGVTLSTTMGNPLHDIDTLSSQTHAIPLSKSPLEGSAEILPGLSRREQREQQRRQMREEAGKSGFGATLPWERERIVAMERNKLHDGLSFPGLYVEERIGKHKEFRLRLQLSQPGADRLRETTSIRRPGQKRKREQNPGAQDEDYKALTDELRTLENATDYDFNSLSALQDFQPPSNPNSSNCSPRLHSHSPTWATLYSSPLSVVSKPSQKTGRARSLVSCLTEQETFAMFVRINSQTVRTKYMRLEAGTSPRLSSRTGIWSPFRFHIIKRASFWESDKARTSGTAESLPGVLTYGSIVNIVEINTGIQSEPLQLVKVDKNEAVVGHDEGHPVSDLQRIGLVRCVEQSDDQPRLYLSAPGSRAESDKSKTPAELTSSPTDSVSLTTLKEATSQSDDAMQNPLQLPRKKRTKRTALVKATLGEDNESSSLTWQQSTREFREIDVEREKPERKNKPAIDAVKVNAFVERVEDWMCWVITSVDSFQQTIQAPLKGTESLDPIPHLLTIPRLHLSSHTLDLIISPLDTDFDICLGTIVLHSSLWRSTSVRDNGKSVGETPAVRVDGGPDSVRGRRIATSWPSHIAHHLVVSELPPIDEIIQGYQSSARIDDRPMAEISDSAEAWMREQTALTTGEMTIQEALQNAESAFQEELGLTAYQEDGMQRRNISTPVELEPSATSGKLPQEVSLSFPATRSPEHPTSMPISLVRRSDGVIFDLGKALQLLLSNDCWEMSVVDSIDVAT